MSSLRRRLRIFSTATASSSSNEEEGEEEEDEKGKPGGAAVLATARASLNDENRDNVSRVVAPSFAARTSSSDDDVEEASYSVSDSSLPKASGKYRRHLDKYNRMIEAELPDDFIKKCIERDGFIHLIPLMFDDEGRVIKTRPGLFAATSSTFEFETAAHPGLWKFDGGNSVSVALGGDDDAAVLE